VGGLSLLLGLLVQLIHTGATNTSAISLGAKLNRGPRA